MDSSQQALQTNEKLFSNLKFVFEILAKKQEIFTRHTITSQFDIVILRATSFNEAWNTNQSLFKRKRALHGLDSMPRRMNKRLALYKVSLQFCLIVGHH